MFNFEDFPVYLINYVQELVLVIQMKHPSKFSELKGSYKNLSIKMIETNPTNRESINYEIIIESNFLIVQLKGCYFLHLISP